MEVLLSGLAPPSDEISWLKQEAARGNVPLLNVSPLVEPGLSQVSCHINFTSANVMLGNSSTVIHYS